MHQNQNGLSINITSTLSSEASILEGTTVQCAAVSFTSNPYTVSVRGKPSLYKCLLKPLVKNEFAMKCNEYYYFKSIIIKYNLLQCSHNFLNAKNTSSC